MLWEIVQAMSPLSIDYPQLPPLDEISRQMTLIEEGARRQCIGSTRTMIDVAERVGRMFNHRADAEPLPACGERACPRPDRGSTA